MTISGALRPGISPALSLVLDAPVDSLQEVRRLLSLPSALEVQQGSAALHLTASYGNGLLAVAGDLIFVGITPRLQGRSIPLTGHVKLVGEYDTGRDEARITRGAPP